MKKFVWLALVCSLLLIAPIASAIENGYDTSGYCNVIPEGVKVRIDSGKIVSSTAFSDENDLAYKMNQILLLTTIENQSYISNAGTSVTFGSKTWTTPPTYMLHMAVNSLLVYSTDLVNWYSTGMSVMASESGYQATNVDAQTTVGVTGGRYYMAWGCHQGGYPNYHYDDLSPYIYVP
jgi:hypothetical protein